MRSEENERRTCRSRERAIENSIGNHRRQSLTGKVRSIRTPTGSGGRSLRGGSVPVPLCARVIEGTDVHGEGSFKGIVPSDRRNSMGKVGRYRRLKRHVRVSPRHAYPLHFSCPSKGCLAPTNEHSIRSQSVCRVSQTRSGVCCERSSPNGIQQNKNKAKKEGTFRSRSFLSYFFERTGQKEHS